IQLTGKCYENRPMAVAWILGYLALSGAIRPVNAHFPVSSRSTGDTYHLTIPTTPGGLWLAARPFQDAWRCCDEACWRSKSQRKSGARPKLIACCEIALEVRRA